MQILSESDIVSLVRRTINESLPNESDFYSGDDDSETDGIIRSRISEALSFVNGTSDYSLLDPDKTVTEVSMTKNVGPLICGIVSVPGYLRLKSIQVEGWSKVLTETGYPDDPDYPMQSDPYACGTCDRPSCFLCSDESGEKTIELYTLPSDDSKVRVEYMEIPVIDEESGSVHVSDRLKDPFVYYLSFLVLTVLNDPHADDFLNLSLSLMGVGTKKEGGES